MTETCWSTTKTNRARIKRKWPILISLSVCRCLWKEQSKRWRRSYGSQRTSKLKVNVSFKLLKMFRKYFNFTTAIRAVRKWIYQGSQWSSLVWDCKVDRYWCRRHFDTLLARVQYELSVRRRNSHYTSSRQFVVLSMETWKLYITSEPPSTILVGAPFVLRDSCHFSILRRFTLVSKQPNH